MSSRVALVAGSSSGIGAEVARRLAGDDFAVAACGSPVTRPGPLPVPVTSHAARLWPA
jgi:NAD(P)-dependent dehydrogenase (short-subunit alcohol dehydrogenase family)